MGVQEADAKAEALFILEQISGLSHAEQLIADESVLDQNALSWIDTILAKRALHVPIQYCLGEASFAGLNLHVESGVLIPRPDTETVVETLLERLKEASCSARQIAEIGVGAGPISIALLKRLPELKIWGCDVSPKAISITLKNALRHGVADRLNLVLGDWREILPTGFDAIVSNPPYIPIKKKAEMPPEIVENEPAQALFVDDEDGLSFIRIFAEKLPAHLKEGGIVAFELGDGQAEGARGILEKAGWQAVRVDSDTHNLARVISANIIGPR